MQQQQLFTAEPPVVQSIRVLTWKEPFGSLMLHDKIETRKWDTKYRGLVLICVGVNVYNQTDLFNISGPEHMWRIRAKLNDGPDYTGKAIAVADLIHTYKMRPEDSDRCYVQYKAGLYCHVYTNVRPIVPIPFKGQQGWRTIDDISTLDLQFI